MDKSKDIVIRFLSDTRHFETGAKGVASAMTKVEDISMKSAAKMALGFMGVEIGIQGVKAALLSTITSSMDYENVVTNMTVLLGGNAKAANWLAGELEDLSNRTPLEFQDLALAGQSLLAAEIPLDRVSAKLKQLGDVAQFSKIGLSGVTDLFTKAKGIGKVQGEIFEQLSTANLLPVMTEMAKIMGTNVAGLRELGSKGKVTFDIFDKAIVNLTSAGGKYFEGMEKGSKTMAGIWSTSLDFVKSLMKAFTGVKEGDEGSTLWTKIKDTLSDILVWANKALVVIGPILKFLGSVIGAVLKAVWDVGKVLAVVWFAGIVKFLPIIYVVLTVIKWIAQFVSWIINGFIDMGVAIIKWISNLSFVKGFIQDIKIIFLLVKLWIDAVIDSAVMKLEKLRDSFKNFFTDLFTVDEKEVKIIKAGSEVQMTREREMYEKGIGPYANIKKTYNKISTQTTNSSPKTIVNVNLASESQAKKYLNGNLSGAVAQ